MRSAIRFAVLTVAIGCDMSAPPSGTTSTTKGGAQFSGEDVADETATSGDIYFKSKDGELISEKEMFANAAESEKRAAKKWAESGLGDDYISRANEELASLPPGERAMFNIALTKLIQHEELETRDSRALIKVSFMYRVMQYYNRVDRKEFEKEMLPLLLDFMSKVGPRPKFKTQATELKQYTPPE